MTQREIIYLAAIAILLILFGRQCEKGTDIVSKKVIIRDTIRVVDSVVSPVPVDIGVPDRVWVERLEELQYKLDSVACIGLDTIERLTLDTIFLYVEDYLLPKTYSNTYGDSTYSLTVTDSIIMNSLAKQWVDVEVYNKTIIRNQSSLFIGASLDPTGGYGGVMYQNNGGWMAGVGYNPLNKSVGVGLYIKALSW